MSRIWGWSGDAIPEEKSGRVRDRGVDALEAKLNRTLLTCEALWTLLREKLNLTDVELVDRINALDLSDGRLDGRMRKTPVSCPACKRALSPRMPKCLYCGQEIIHDPFL
ncbi:MAG: hypothetical protein AABZ47_03730 [Planctomycetota bacterium]